MKLHAWVVREIEINEEQVERLVNRLCGCVENADINDIKAQFMEGIECGDYDRGYIPWRPVDTKTSMSPRQYFEYLQRQ